MRDPICKEVAELCNMSVLFVVSSLLGLKAERPQKVLPKTDQNSMEKWRFPPRPWKPWTVGEVAGARFPLKATKQSSSQSLKR